MLSRISCHKDLIVWKKSVELAGKVYAATRHLPREERWGMSLQLRRSALSVPSNIAAGCARRSRTEYVQFLCIARGSLAELETQLMVAAHQNFLPPGDDSQSLADEVGQLLNGLIARLANAPRAAHARACRRDQAPANP